MQIMIGADPELFMKQNLEFVSAHGMVPGSKSEPFPVDNGAVQVDGMALEFNINPAKEEEEFVFNISSVMQQLKGMLPTFEIVAEPVAHFGFECIKAQPLEAVILGCDPDFNAWLGGEENPTPDGDKPFRTGAGHIHIGWTDNEDIHDLMHVEACMSIVRQLDFYLGLPSLLFDGDPTRREMYGAAGCFRPKPYGVEYRVLSNRWLSTEELQRWVYSNTMKAIDSLQNGNNLAEIYGDIQEVINTSDVQAATELIKLIDIEIPNVTALR